MIKIGSAEAEKGSLGSGYLKIGELAMNSEILIPVLIVRGRHSGPVLWLNGAVHGDEINGFMAMRNIAGRLNREELNGSIICTPLSNPLAVQWRNKINPYDFLDMDQQFPGKPDGQYSQRAAYILFREIRAQADYLINFHTVATAFDAEPYTVYKYAPGMNDNQKEALRNLAMAFGVTMNCCVDLSKATGEIPGGVAGALDINCSLSGIPAFMAEVGSGGVFDESRIAVAEEGILNVMIYLNMINGKMGVPGKRIIVSKRSFLYADTAGFLRMLCNPGETISRGDEMAKIIDLFSELDAVRVKDDAVVIMTRKNPVVHSGDRIAFLGYDWEEV